MSNLGWLLLGVMSIVTGLSLCLAWHLATELDRLKGEHARARVRDAEARFIASLRRVPALQPHAGHHRPSREPATLPSLLLASEDATAHADAMHAASEEYLPPSPAGEHPYPPYAPAPEVSPEEWWSYVNAGRAVEPVRTGEHPPWTGSQPALTPELEAAERRRIDWAAAQLAALGDNATPEAVADVLIGLRALPVTDVTAEGERLASLMQQ